MLARCPSCRNTFSTERSGRQDCPVCGKPLLVPELPPLDAAPADAQPRGPAQPDDSAPWADPGRQAPDGGGPASEPQGTPWERRAELGPWHAWSQTVRQALLEPTKLFASARLDRNGAQLGFVMTLSVFWIIGQLFSLLLPPGPDQLLRYLERTLPPDQVAAAMQFVRPGLQSRALTLLFLLLTPAMLWVLLYLNAAVTHLLALLFGQARRGFPATFAACAYGLTPLVLIAIPGCGSIIAGVWIIVLIGVGLKETHGISSGGAAVTVLAPYLVFCCLCCGGVAALGFAMSRGLGAH